MSLVWSFLTDTSWPDYVLPLLLVPFSFLIGRNLGRTGTLRQVRNGARTTAYAESAIVEHMVDEAIREGGAEHRRRLSALLRDSPAFSPVTPIDRDRDGFWRQTLVALLRTSPAFAGVAGGTVSPRPLPPPPLPPMAPPTPGPRSETPPPTAPTKRAPDPSEPAGEAVASSPPVQPPPGVDDPDVGVLPSEVREFGNRRALELALERELRSRRRRRESRGERLDREDRRLERELRELRLHLERVERLERLVLGEPSEGPRKFSEPPDPLESPGLPEPPELDLRDRSEPPRQSERRSSPSRRED